MCLVGVKIPELSRRDWDLHELCILVSVVIVGPHIVRRVFHIPLVMVHPNCGWARVVSPSLVMIEKPSIFSSHSSDLRCICTQPRPLSSRGQGLERAPSESEILVLESVTRSGWLAINGFGSGSHMISSPDEVTGNVSFDGLVLGGDQRQVSSRHLARASVREGIRSEESIARHLS